MNHRLPGSEPGHVEQIVDEAGLHHRVAFDDPDRLAYPGLVERVLREHVRPAEDGIERRAQLVRDDRQELVLHPARRFGLAPGRLRLGELAPLLFRAAALGDIQSGAEQPDRTSRRVPDGAAAAGEHALGAVRPDDPVIDLEEAACLERLANRRLDACAIVLVHAVDERRDTSR